MDDALREAKQIARDVTIEELRQGRAGRGLASVVAVSANRQAEVGLIGCEGMTGLGVVLGGEIAPYNIVVQIEGDALSLEAGELVQLLNQSPSLRPALLRYVHVFVKQTAQTALLSARGNLTHRLVCWLLMAHDRIGSEELRLTQDCLAMILRVQRASVNIALRHLQSRGLISTTRKSIVIRKPARP